MQFALSAQSRDVEDAAEIASALSDALLSLSGICVRCSLASASSSGAHSVTPAIAYEERDVTRPQST